MIVARLSSGVFILGLDDENIKRLTSGQPILKSLAQFGGTDDVAIVHGKTLGEIQEQLEEHFGSMPDPQKLPENS